ncbi:MAG: hypothetical protein FD150_2285 [Rhodobacteraceae bacterium]|nr:MAG: hypothetical protein FD150_2285 [Paracoccaceae bacterium]
MPDFKVIKQFACPFAASFGRPARKIQHDRDVLFGGQKGQQVVRLKDKADLVQAQPSQIAAEPFAVEHRIAIQFDPARGRGKNAADHVQQRRLARTGRAQQRDDFADMHPQIHGS